MLMSAKFTDGAAPDGDHSAASAGLATGALGERLPPWLRAKAAPLGAGDTLRMRLRADGLHTVCEEARCPNLADCFGRGVATFMLLGAVCTRQCGFCAVAGGEPQPVDADEPQRLAQNVARLGLRHVVLTSVDRDDLSDAGAGHFAATIVAIRGQCPGVTVEVLTPDFGGVPNLINRVVDAVPEVFNHNLETVRRLQERVRPQGDYERSLGVLKRAKMRCPQMLTKSGLMVGLGETDDELLEACEDLRAVGCDLLTMGQYLRPGRRQLPVARYLSPDGFAELKGQVLKMGFKHVAAAPRVRSSFNAGAVLAALRDR